MSSIGMDSRFVALLRSFGRRAALATITPMLALAGSTIEDAIDEDFDGPLPERPLGGGRLARVR